MVIHQMAPSLLFLSPLSFAPTSRVKKSHHNRKPPLHASLILGLNQYTHDAAVAVMHSVTGHLLYAQSKERLTRRKHDAGDLSLSIRYALQAVGADPDDVILVVANNHHFRIAPFERRLPFTVSLRYQPASYLSPFNLLGANNTKGATPRKVELSHHLAHAYSAVYAAPFDRGVVLIMDGMGDALDDWLIAGAPSTSGHDKTTVHDSNYYTEESVCHTAHDFREFPADVRSRPGTSFREAETAYIFNRDGGQIEFTRIWKRWAQEIAPSELPNHSFEDMTSVGAMYSRVSSILFKDWNACGKVMGLAPYARTEQLTVGAGRYFIHGNLFDGTIRVSEGQRKGLEFIGKNMSDCDESEDGQRLRRHFENLAYRIQADLEDVTSSLVSNLMEYTGEQNLVFAGGVALNSSANGMLSENPKVHQLYVPPFPGDEGISIGCALFGRSNLLDASPRPYKLPALFMPYLGKQYSETEIMDAIECFSPWINWRMGDVGKETANALGESKVVAWFNGKSEFGPRSLGCRSILADPRNRSMLSHVNKVVKKREPFRPFAPTVLSEHAPDWFYDCSTLSSPFMSLTKRAKKPELIPAVVHIDGTSRLQTLMRQHNFAYHDMISYFYELTGVPMVLNTSFNVAGEPIVESPADALISFLDADGIDYLVFPGIIVEKITVTTLSDSKVVSSACSFFRSEHVQDCNGNPIRTRVTYTPKNFVDDGSEDNINESIIELADHLQLAILETIQESCSSSVSNILDEFCLPGPEEEDFSDQAEHNVPSRGDVRHRLADLCNKRLIQVER